MSHPTPLQWTFVINEFKENLEVLKKNGCRFALILDVKLIGLISTNYIIDFVNLLKENHVLLEAKLISTSIIYEGVLMNKMFEILKLFYQTKKPIEFVPDMNAAVAFVDKNV
jgi:hypothetical protein